MSLRRFAGWALNGATGQLVPAESCPRYWWVHRLVDGARYAFVRAAVPAPRIARAGEVAAPA
ncbi:hypothetical protein [Streptomyces sp. NPDC001889]